jgi:hypothetical protein
VRREGPGESRSTAHGLVRTRRCGRFGGPSSHLGIGYGNQEPQSVVDRGGILECLGDVRVEEHDIRALAIALVVLAANRPGEVVPEAGRGRNWSYVVDSYLVLSRRVARRALMIRTAPSLSVWTTTSRRSELEVPIVTSLTSSTESYYTASRC